MPDVAPDLEAIIRQLNDVEWSLRALAELVGASGLNRLPRGLDILLDSLADQLDRVQLRLTS